MRILLLCNKPPYPPKDGGSLAMFSLIRGLLDAGHVLKVMAFNADKYGVSLADIPSSFRQETDLELIRVDLPKKIWLAIWYLLTGKSYQLSRFYKRQFATRLKEVLTEGFDIVQFETVFPAVYLDLVRKYSRAKIVLRAHNIENLIWKQLAENEKRTLRKWYLGKTADSLRQFELKVFSKVDGIAAITPNDMAYIEIIHCKTPLICIPFSINPDTYSLNSNIAVENTIFHLAAMNWMPNEEGIRWFLGKVWPLVLRQKSDAKLRLAGRHMPDWINNLQSVQIDVAGEVSDSWIFMQENKVMIVPLFAGSGVRVKIIEGMLAGKAIISTTKGAAGIAVSHNENIILADTPSAFASAVVNSLEDPQMAAQLGKKAREFVLEHHNINKIVPKLTDFYLELQDYS